MQLNLLIQLKLRLQVFLWDLRSPILVIFAFLTFFCLFRLTQANFHLSQRRYNGSNRRL